MDLNVIKKKLNSMQKPSSNGKEDYQSLNKFKPSIGKQKIRVVPFKFNKNNPFTEMLFYYNIGSRKLIASPMNWGDKDPIAEFVKQLKGTNDKENWRLAKKLYPKTRVFVPVIVRGEEDKGVQMWEFGKLIYEEFLQLAADEEVGDFTDVMEGRDIKITTVGPDVTGTKYNKTTISPSMKTSPLSDDEDQIEKWLEDQQNPKDTYRPLSFDKIKEALQEWLDPGEEEDEEPQNFEEEKKAEPQSNYSLSTQEAAKKDKGDKFDELFEEDEEEGDDLPF